MQLPLAQRRRLTAQNKVLNSEPALRDAINLTRTFLVRGDSVVADASGAAVMLVPGRAVEAAGVGPVPGEEPCRNAWWQSCAGI